MIWKNKVKRIAIITSILLTVFFVGLYILGTQGEAYKYAVKRVRESPTVTNKIGPVKSTRLALIGYSVRYDGPHGHAEYKIHVKGERGGGTAYIYLEKSLGIWEMKKGNLILKDGVSVPIS